MCVSLVTRTTILEERERDEPLYFLQKLSIVFRYLAKLLIFGSSYCGSRGEQWGSARASLHVAYCEFVVFVPSCSIQREEMILILLSVVEVIPSKCRREAVPKAMSWT